MNGMTCGILMIISAIWFMVLSLYPLFFSTATHEAGHAIRYYKLTGQHTATVHLAKSAFCGPLTAQMLKKYGITVVKNDGAYIRAASRQDSKSRGPRGFTDIDANFLTDAQIIEVAAAGHKMERKMFFIYLAVDAISMTFLVLLWMISLFEESIVYMIPCAMLCTVFFAGYVIVLLEIVHYANAKKVGSDRYYELHPESYREE